MSCTFLQLNICCKITITCPVLFYNWIFVVRFQENVLPADLNVSPLILGLDAIRVRVEFLTLWNTGLRKIIILTQAWEKLNICCKIAIKFLKHGPEKKLNKKLQQNTLKHGPEKKKHCYLKFIQTISNLFHVR